MKKRLKTITAIALTIAMAASLTACGSSNKSEGTSTETATETSKTKDTLTVAISGDVGNMSPVSKSSNATYLTYQIYEPLFDLGYDMAVTPVLAESWEQIDNTHYTLKIRKDVKDSAGNPFTAKDVLYVFGVYSQDAENSAYVANVDLTKTIATDDYTIDLYLLQPNAYTFTNLSSVRMFTQASWEASTDKMVTNPVGTGAYKLKDYVSGSYVEIEARDDYWGGAPTIRTAKFTVISEPSQATTALETGEVDLVMSLQSSDADYIKSVDGLTTLVDPAISSMSMFFNMTDSSVFKDKAVRQALCYSLDNATINKIAYGGFASPSLCPFSTAMADYVPQLDSDMYKTSDVTKAKSLLSEAGVSGGKIKIATDGTPQETAIAEIVQSTLMELGFEAEINNYDSATIWDVASDSSQWDIILNMTASPSGYGLDQLNAFLGFLNWGKWSGAEYDKFTSLYAEAIASATPIECQEKTIQAVQIVEDVVPTYSVVQLSNIYAFKNNLNFKVWNQATLLVKDLKFE